MSDINNINVDLNKVLEEEKKANAQGYAIFKIKEQNKADFVQVIKKNLRVLIEKKYLTNAQLSFLISITQFVEFHTNAIANDSGQFKSVSEIAQSLDRRTNGVSVTINELIGKGIILEIIDGAELRAFGRVVTERPLFMNPEIIYAGDRNKVDAMLSKLTIEFDKFERNKILLPYKVWLNKHEKCGRLYDRKTYLKYKKMRI